MLLLRRLVVLLWLVRRRLLLLLMRWGWLREWRMLRRRRGLLARHQPRRSRCRRLPPRRCRPVLQKGAPFSEKLHRAPC